MGRTASVSQGIGPGRVCTMNKDGRRVSSRQEPRFLRRAEKFPGNSGRSETDTRAQASRIDSVDSTLSTDPIEWAERLP
jgi:hypothetical protein